MSLRYIFSVALLSGLFIQCASTTDGGNVGLGRKQLLLVSSEELENKSAEAYDQVLAEARQKNTLDRSPTQLARIQRIAKQLIPQTTVFRKDASHWRWEVHLQSNEELNAYCMPGGKIMFYTGIIDKLQLTDAEIAAIMGHEVAHALREHGREQMSEQLLKIGLLQLGVESGVVNEKYAEGLMLLSNLIIDLPHSRNQETEADIVGLELMARAGYDPEAAIDLWNKMRTNGGGKPPEILSTHPADETRIQNIRSQLAKVKPLYQQSRSR